MASDTLFRVFAVLGTLSALMYFFSSRQLQKADRIAAQNAAAESETQLADIKQQLSSAENKIEEFRKQNSQLGRDLEEEKEARLQVQIRFGPRGILPDNAFAMAEILRPFAGQKVNFAYFTELETAAFAQRIVELLKTSGWKPQVLRLKSMQPLYGVHCGGANADDAVVALRQALTLVDKHVTSQDSDAAGIIRSVQPQAADQPWVLVALKRPHLRRHAGGGGAAKEGDTAGATPAPGSGSR